MSLAENIISHQGYGRSEDGISLTFEPICLDHGIPRLASEAVCSGCAACMAVCQKNAVNMVRREKNGFLYPEIDGEKCIRCGKCSRICPALHVKENENSFYSQAFAADNRDMEARFRAASGAMFEALAKSILEKGGAVAGVAYTADLRGAKHVLAEEESQLLRLCGTKYFQSDMQGVYGDIRAALKHRGKKVMFCGTPCQVRAIKSYAEEEDISDSLVTVDLICRGIPSPLAWEKYLEYLENRHKRKIKTIKVKDKEKGWDRIGVMITFEDGSRAYERWLESVFERSFIQTNLSIRESCFSCPYKSIHREGDITIGDFWGLRNTNLLEGNMGTSLLLVNSPKGMELFEWTKSKLDFRPSTMWRVWRGNIPAFAPVFCDKKKREDFWRLLGDGRNLEEAVELAAVNDNNGDGQ